MNPTSISLSFHDPTIIMTNKESGVKVMEVKENLELMNALDYPWNAGPGSPFGRPSGNDRIVFGEGDLARINSEKVANFLFVSGEPLKEPVAWRGPSL
jgi:hypothetical protein